MKLRFFSKIIILTLILSNIINIFAFAEETSSNTSKSKVIYLTFDDGPARKVTTDILDILREEDVNATFFLIGEQIKGQENIIKRMHEEGHSLGLHSMTHKKNDNKCNINSNRSNFTSNNTGNTAFWNKHATRFITGYAVYNNFI